MQLLVSVEDVPGGERVCAETPDGAVTVEVVPAPGVPDEGSCQLAVLPDGTARVVEGELPAGARRLVTVCAAGVSAVELRRAVASSPEPGPGRAGEPAPVLLALRALGIFPGEAPGPSRGRPAGKARHRWRPELAELPLRVRHEGSEATVVWEARDRLRVLAGATLRPDPPLNRDGSLGFAARFALRLREEHAGAISGARTTEDIVLRSVNEVGHLLYFAGTNSWRVLRDDDGRTLDELAR